MQPPRRQRRLAVKLTAFALAASVVTVLGSAPLAHVLGPAAAPLAAQGTPDVDALLAAVRGTPPVSCELVVQALGVRRSAPEVRPRINVPGGLPDPERSLAEWSLQGRLGPVSTPPVLAALASDDPCERRVAARLVAFLDDPTIGERLAQRLQGGGTDARLAVVQALSYLRTPASAVTLSEVLRGEGAALRAAAAWALAGARGDAAVEPLVAALGDSDPSVRENAAWALGRIRGQTALAALTRALQDDGVGVRVNAAWALGQLANAEAVPALVQLLASDPSPETRAAAAWALGRIEGGSSAPGGPGR